jgi:hypothetical protein
MKRFFIAVMIFIFSGAVCAQNRSRFYELNPAQSVTIEDKSRSINFKLEAASGDEIFKLRGTAKLIRKNVFEYRKVARGKIENYDCRILFAFSRRQLIVKETDDCSFDRAQNITLDGAYQFEN